MIFDSPPKSPSSKYDDTPISTGVVKKVVHLLVEDNEGEDAFANHSWNKVGRRGYSGK